jgi:hypothetical protein
MDPSTDMPQFKTMLDVPEVLDEAKSIDPMVFGCP